MALSLLAGAAPAARPSTPDIIVDALRRAILSGSIGGGTQLKQNEVAARFGVSVVPVREALQRLVAEGLAVLRPNRGVTVTPLFERDFLEIAEMRSLLEPHALRYSIPNLTEADFATAESLLKQGSRVSDAFERAELHWGFHRSLYQKADRPRLLDQIATLYRSINRYLLPVWNDVGLSSDWMDSHMLILQAAGRRDINRASQLVVDQIFAASDRVRAQLRSMPTVQKGKPA
jgi:DNA-binding GntR family transcriptional regulator